MTNSRNNFHLQTSRLILNLSNCAFKVADTPTDTYEIKERGNSVTFTFLKDFKDMYWKIRVFCSEYKLNLGAAVDYYAITEGSTVPSQIYPKIRDLCSDYVSKEVLDQILKPDVNSDVNSIGEEFIEIDPSANTNPEKFKLWVSANSGGF